MKIISGARRSGKTAQLIKESAETGRYILVRSTSEVDSLVRLARELNVSMPYPVTISEVTNGKTKGSSMEREGILVDNAMNVLQELLQVKIMGATVELDLIEKRDS
ncbi:hypothetical protein BAU15_05305 [Enterococcus sp. JM4C]|uniref:replicase n=1 Tax=Candidatus Enterococcus huntleyi TaxID=1857217 RepID=UPI00137AD467|nr:replicase [Enterococcus sp. JM4C]KAF1295170.1 hypothetical protein BAU15_05305 [Enterococcus sp. JM4C]